MKNIILFLILISASINAQQLTLSHLQGPMGGMVGDIVLDSSDNLYAGIYGNAGYYRGIFKSTDDGKSWLRLETQPRNFEIYSLHYSRRNELWAGTNGDSGIYKSTDGGRTWIQKNTGFPGVTCWAFGETRSGVLFAVDNLAGVVSRSTDNGEHWTNTNYFRAFAFHTTDTAVFAAGTDGLYISLDTGKTWYIHPDLIGKQFSSFTQDSRKNIYAGTGYWTGGEGVYFSSNGGRTWQHRGLSGETVLSLLCAENDVLFAGTKSNAVYRSTDYGITWERRTSETFKYQAFRLKMNKQKKLFLGSENEGVLVSVDTAKTFSLIGVPVAGVYQTAMYKDSVVLCATVNGIQKYNLRTGIWTSDTLKNTYYLSATRTGIVYAASYGDGIYKSSNGGNNWVKLSVVPAGIEQCGNIKGYGSDTLFIAIGTSLYVTTNRGNIWSSIPVSVPGNTIAMFKNTLLLGGTTNNFNGIFKSYNLGRTFASVNGHLSDNKNTLITAPDGTGYLASSSGLFRSDTSYVNWTRIDTTPLVSIAVNSNGTIAAAGPNMVMVSSNNGISWSKINLPGDNPTFIYDITALPGGEFIVSTYSNGIFKLGVTTDIKNENPVNTADGFFISQNYPNPFNPYTTIEYTLRERGRVTIDVFNSLGVRISTLTDEVKDAGNYSAVFNGSKYSSGVYFYRVNFNGNIVTKRMVLMK